MSDLIERLEKATEGSRELDTEIWMAAIPGVYRKQWSYTHLATGKVCDVDETRDATGRLIIVHHYTTSLDAAMTLVPEGYNGSVAFGKHSGAILWKGHPQNHLGDHMAPTPALALCIAALKARESGNG